MIFLPEWAPNLHPLIIHFPIVLLIVAVAVDLVVVFVRRFPKLHAMAVGLYVAGAVALAAAFWSGRAAIDAVQVPTAATATLTDHETWALYTLIFFGAYALIRIGVFIATRRPRLAPALALWIVGAAGLGLLWQTADRGSELVYAHGVGIQAVETLAAEMEQLQQEMRIAEAEPVQADGSWQWTITGGAAEVFPDIFSWHEGSADALSAEEIEDAEEGTVLRITPESSPLFISFGDTLQSVEVQSRLRLDDFEGILKLVHNITGSDTFHFTRLDGERLTQGRRIHGEREVLDEGPAPTSGWITLRTTGDQGHFYSYVNGQTIAHGHTTSEPAPGLAGIWLDGTGTFDLKQLHVEPLR